MNPSNHFTRVVCICFLVLAAWSTGAAQAADANPGLILDDGYALLRDQLSPKIAKEMKDLKVKGLTIALIDGSKVVWAEGFGLADERAGKPTTPETIFDAGTLATLFNATSAAQLAASGVLDLDAPLAKLLPGFSMKSRFASQAQITPRNILSHHSGLPSNYLRGSYSPKPLAFEDILKALREEYVSYPPDTIFSYSNLGYELLGAVQERVSGVSYEELLKRSLFTPLGMAKTSIRLPDEDRPNASKAYLNGKEFNEPQSSMPRAQTLHTTVLDLAKFALMVLRQGEVDGRKEGFGQAVTAMLTPANEHVPLDMDLKVGFGWTLSKQALSQAGRIAWRSGRSLAQRSQLVILPDHGLAVAILANSDSAENYRDPMIDRVVQFVLLDVLEAKQAKLVRPTRAREEVAPAIQSDSPKLATDIRKAASGLYSTVIGPSPAWEEDGQLMCELDESRLLLRPDPDGFFNVEYKVLGLIPFNVSKKRKLRISYPQIGERRVMVLEREGYRETFGQKLDPATIPPAWKARTGDYEIENLGQDFPLFKAISLREENGFIVFKTTLPAAFNFKLNLPLILLSDSDAVISGLGGYTQVMGQHIRAVGQGQAERILCSGLVLKRK